MAGASPVRAAPAAPRRGSGLLAPRGPATVEAAPRRPGTAGSGSGRPVRAIVQRATDAGYAAVLVTTTQLTHTTPAAFAAHVEDRDDPSAIAGSDGLVSRRAQMNWGTGNHSATDVPVYATGGGSESFAGHRQNSALIGGFEAFLGLR